MGRRVQCKICRTTSGVRFLVGAVDIRTCCSDGIDGVLEAGNSCLNGSHCYEPGLRCCSHSTRNSCLSNSECSPVGDTSNLRVFYFVDFVMMVLDFDHELNILWV